MVAAIALGPASACVLFEGPSDYPPRDAAAVTDAPTSFDAGQDAVVTTDGAGDGFSSDALADTSLGDGAIDAAPPPADANGDALGCGKSGQGCQSSTQCCSGDCLTATSKCK